MIERDCVFEHEGMKFEAGGAWLVDGRGLVYVSKTETGFKVTDWHGNVLGEVVSHRIGDKVWGAHGYYRMAYVRVRVDGMVYSGRYNYDGSQAVKVKRVSK